MSANENPQIPSLMEEASQLAREGEWETAAATWDLVVTSAQAAHLEEAALSAAIKAADALRRAERPLDAIRALRRVIDMTDNPRILAAQDVQLVGVLLAAGQLEGAEQLAEARAEDLPSGTLRAVAIDTLLGVFLATGNAEGFEAWLDHLEDTPSDHTAIATRFRRGQQLRIQGSLNEAAVSFAYTIESLSDAPGAQGARAAARFARAEIALLQGDYANALEQYEQAKTDWVAVGRKGAVYRAEAGRLHALLLQATTGVLPTTLDDAITFAWGRGLALLEAELRVTRAECKKAIGIDTIDEDFERACVLADESGAKWLAGRCRYRWFRANGAGGTAILRHAIDLLEGDVPWRALVELELAKVLTSSAPEEARSLAEEALDRFTDMSMTGPQAEAIEVLERLEA